jgi:hypothetical protein
MSLEILNTFGSLATAAIVAATAVAALIQLRHLRAGNQINAILTIGEQLNGQSFREAQTLVNRRLESAMQDPAFLNFLAAFARGLTSPDVSEDYKQLRGAAGLVGDTYDELGVLVKNGTVARDLFLDHYSWRIIRTWDRLQNCTTFLREAWGTSAVWENFEFLTVLAQDWAKDYASGTYPKGMRRLQMYNARLVSPAP